MKRKLSIILILLFTVVTLFANQATGIVYAEDAISPITFETKAYLLLDYNTGTVLLNSNEDQELQVASIVKLMTTLLALEALDEGTIKLDDMVIASDYSASMGGSQAFLDAGQEYEIKELLKSIIVASANDSSVLMAEIVGGSEENFTKLMNERAGKLKMYNTLYANSTGLPAANQYSTAKDAAKILKEVMKHKEYFDYSTIWMDDFVHPLDGRATELTNTNRLTRYYKGCDAGKTGYTDEAGYCLSASARKGDMRLVAVALGSNRSKERFQTVSEMLDYGFANYKNEKIVEKGQELDQMVKIRGSKYPSVKLAYEQDFYYITRKGSDDNFEVKLDLPKGVKAPIKQGDAVGMAYIVKEGEVLAEITVVSLENYEKQTVKDVLHKIFKGWNINK